MSMPTSYRPKAMLGTEGPRDVKDASEQQRDGLRRIKKLDRVVGKALSKR